MKLILAALFCTAVLAIETAPVKGWRLLKTSEEEPAFWAPPVAAEALGVLDIGFMDITETQEVRVVTKSLDIPSAPSHQSEVNSLISNIDVNRVASNIEHFSSYNNRYYTSSTGVQSATWLYEQLVELTQNRSDATVEYFEHSFAQPSVLVRLPGRTSDDLVILGSHQDSTAPGMPTGRAPGADDDASGTFTVFEALRVLLAANFYPENTLEFHFYAAEEAGLLGSQAVASEYSRVDAPVRAMLQMDMTGYPTSSGVGVITDFTDSDLNAFIRQLINTYLTIGYTDSRCGYGCSDHASWNRVGYRSAFPFEAPFGSHNPRIHTPNDLLEHMSLDHVSQFVRLALAFAVELAYE